MTDRASDDGQSALDPLALNRLDWYAAIIACIVLVLAPLLAGDFANPAAISASTETLVFGAIGMPVITLLAAMATLILILREWRKPVGIGIVPGLSVSFGLLVAWSAVSIARTRAFNLSLNTIVALIAALLCGWIVSRLARDRKCLVSLLISITVAGTIVATVGISEYISYFKQHVAEHRSYSTFSDPNFLAGYLLMTLPVAIGIFASARVRWLQLLAGAGIVIQSAGLWLSGSRAASGVVIAALILFGLIAVFTTESRRTRALGVALALFILGSVPALTPLLSRLKHRAPAPQTASSSGVVSSDAQVNSNEFRKWTWIGTTRMANANPVLGTGIGDYEVAYPRYAETAFTIHAHDSYLQLMAETGYPGVLACLAGLAAASAYAANALMQLRAKRLERVADGEASSAAGSDDQYPYLNTPGLALAGLIAALAASMMHSVLDSDWYVVANLVTLSTVVALIVALSRDLAPLSTKRPQPLGKEIMGLAIAACLILLWRGSSLINSRMNLAMGQTDLDIAIAKHDSAPEEAQANFRQAQEAFGAAASADPFDPEAHLGLAQVSSSSDQRLAELKTAVQISNVGKTCYRLGQYYVTLKDWQAAIDAFEKARSMEPKMLQNLHALYNAYLSAGKDGDAERIMHEATELQFTPYGKVRAMHEAVETEFAFAHAALADLSVKRSDWVSARKEETQALAVFAEYWPGRNWLVNVTSRTPAKRKELCDAYELALQQLGAICSKLGDTDGVKDADQRLQQVKRDRADDEVKASSASKNGAA